MANTSIPLHEQPFRSAERDQLLKAVEDMAPQINDGAVEAEERSDLAPETVAAMRRGGLLKYSAPRIVGGFEVDPITAAEVHEALARVDLCAAWLAVQQATAATACSRVIEDEAFDTLFSGSELPILSGSISPLAGAFTAVPGGYKVNGRWGFLSAVSHSDYVTVAGTLSNPDEAPNPTVGAVIPTSAVRKIDNWKVAGMKASGSFDITVEDVFVPQEMTYAHRMPPARKRDLEGRRGFPPHVNAVAMALGASRRVLDEVNKQALAKTRPGARDSVAHRPHFQYFLGEAEMALQAARASFYAMIEALWKLEREDESSPFEMTAQLTAGPAFVFALGCDIATKALRFVGSNAARLENPLQRFHRDLTVMSLHVQNGDQYFESLGQLLLDFEPVVPGGSNMIGAKAKVEAEMKPREAVNV